VESIPPQQNRVVLQASERYVDAGVLGFFGLLFLSILVEPGDTPLRIVDCGVVLAIVAMVIRVLRIRLVIGDGEVVVVNTFRSVRLPRSEIVGVEPMGVEARDGPWCLRTRRGDRVRVAVIRPGPVPGSRAHQEAMEHLAELRSLLGLEDAATAKASPGASVEWRWVGRYRVARAGLFVLLGVFFAGAVVSSGGLADRLTMAMVPIGLAGSIFLARIARSGHQRTRHEFDSGGAESESKDMDAS
jgi:hypothetical protein